MEPPATKFALAVAMGTLMAIALTGSTGSARAPPAFSLSVVGSAGAAQLRANPLAQQLPGTPAALVAGTSAPSGVTAAAFPGVALALLGGVAMYGVKGRGSGPQRRKWKRIWRRLTRSQMNGRRAVRRDQRPELFGPEKPPLEPKKKYTYYVNKMYKVIREATGDAESVGKRSNLSSST